MWTVEPQEGVEGRGPALGPGGERLQASYIRDLGVRLGHRGVNARLHSCAKRGGNRRRRLAPGVQAGPADGTREDGLRHEWLVARALGARPCSTGVRRIQVLDRDIAHWVA